MEKKHLDTDGLNYFYQKLKTNGKVASAGTADTAKSVTWGNVSGKPSSYTPSYHTHTDGQIELKSNGIGSVTPIDMAISNVHNANRLAFGNPDGITIEYSTDNGSTWADYGATNNQKTALVSGIGDNFIIGKTSSGVTTSYKLRITLNAVKMGVYTLARKLFLNVSSKDAGDCKVFIETATIDAPTTFTAFGTFTIQGWDGWNTIPLAFAWGGYTNQKNKSVLRLTFSIGTLGTTSNNALTIHNILLFGDNYWLWPSSLSKTGHLYDYDVNKNAIFPTGVKATNFYENNTLLSNKYALLTHTHDRIVQNIDNRSAATTEASYSQSIAFKGLKYNSVINNPSSDTYSYLLGLMGWKENSGGHAHELAFNNSGLYHRIASGTTTWKDWQKIATETWVTNTYTTKTALNEACENLFKEIPTKVSQLTNDSGFTNNVGTITGVKMNGASKGTSGVVDLGTVITAHQDISGKVDKVSGKGLSTNDYTTTEKNKLAGIATGANKTVVDSSLNTTSTNPVQNKVINAKCFELGSLINTLDGIKVNKVEGKGLSTNDFTDALLTKLNGIATGATAVTESTVSGWGFKKTDTDTKNTAGATNTTSKIFLIGATSQGSNPQTYSNSKVYETNGVLHANSFDTANGITNNDSHTAIDMAYDDGGSINFSTDIGSVCVNDVPIVTSESAYSIVTLTQSEYDNLSPKDSNTLYIIVG